MHNVHIECYAYALKMEQNKLLNATKKHTIYTKNKKKKKTTRNSLSSSLYYKIPDGRIYILQQFLQNPHWTHNNGKQLLIIKMMSW